MKRLMLLGLDGGDLGYIQSRAARLPYFQQRLRQGNLFTLEAPEALSGSVWPTFYTGAHPGVHGIYQHLIWDAQRMGLRRIGPDWCHYRPFWQGLEQQGHKTVVLDVPYSFPTALKQGAEITDWATHGQTWPTRSSHPQAAALLRQAGKSPIGRETPIQKTPAQLQKIKTRLIDSAAKKGELIQTLARSMDWDMLIAVFGETHRGGHLFFSDDDEGELGASTPLLEVYQAVDRAIAAVADALDPDTALVLFSVHGMARDYAQGHLVRPVMQQINQRFLQQHGQQAAASSKRGQGLVAALRRSVPANLQYAVGAAAPDAVRQWVVEQEIVGGLDWSRTPGFALRTDIRTELRLNLVGRESQGMLEPNSPLHHSYVDFVKRAFLELRDSDTGAQLVDEVIHTHDLFPGQRCAGLPDLVVTWHSQPPVRAAESPLIGSVTAKPTEARGGDHTDYGFALLPEALQPLAPLQEITDLARFSHRFFEARRSRQQGVARETDLRTSGV